MAWQRDFERDEIENLHERMSYPSIVRLLMDIEKNFDRDNNWKLALRHGLTIGDLRAIRHWLFESKMVIRTRVKRILIAKVKRDLKKLKS